MNKSLTIILETTVKAKEETKEETRKEKSTEHLFVETLCRKSGIKIEKGKEDNFKIIGAGGFNNFGKSGLERNITERVKAAEKAQMIILFDADNDIAGRRKYIKEEMNKIEEEIGLNIDYDIFLFPNNEEPGCFENLLEKITVENHQKLLRCFEDYQECIGDNYHKPGIKEKMYAYMSAHIPSRTQLDKMSTAEQWNFENEENWNLNSPYLRRLKDLLKSAGV